MSKFTVMDPSDVATIRAEQTKNASNIGVGVVEVAAGAVRLFPYDQTDEWVTHHPHLHAMAGHEAAALMAGFLIPQTRGFVLEFDSANGQWRVMNRSHLNFPDGNGMRMDAGAFAEVIRALEDTGLLNPAIYP